MSSPITSEIESPASSLGDQTRKAAVDQYTPIVQIDGVSIRYRAPHERIPSLKEYSIRWLKRQIRYHDFWALKDIHLSIAPGEVLGIIGPNGAGKSTLLKVIARVLKPTVGRVRVKGRTAPLLELGAGFDPELTGRENIYLNGAILGHTKQVIDAHFDQIVEFSGLHDFLDAPLRSYSSGMYARLGFSVATFTKPDILIVDEILGVGDAEFQTKSFERILSFQADGTTILLVSHSLSRVEEICSRVIWLDHGEIKAEGTAAAVTSQYLQHNLEKEASRLGLEMQREAVNRWGSRKIEISSVRFTNQSGAVKTIFNTGEPLVIHIEYTAKAPVPSPIFGIAIHRQDGTHITGPNTAQAGIDLGEITGKGTITFRIPYLTLLDGLYQVSVAIVNRNDTETYDYHDRAYPFRVANTSGKNAEQYGLITLRGEWRWEPS